MSLNKLIYTDIAVLSSAPPKYGRFCVDYTNDKIYCSFGIASPSDWVQIFPIDLSPFEILANKITSWGTPTDTQYPSAKLVKDSLDLKADLSGGKIPLDQLPAIARTSVHIVASEVAQLALTAEEGDVVIRTDQSKTYIHNGGTAGTMADWSQILAPTDGAGFVISVNGQTGSVTLTTANIADSVNKRYVTDAQLSVINNTSGTNTGDQDLSSYAKLNITQSFTKAQRVTPVVLTSSGNTVATDFALSNSFELTLTENTTLANPTNCVAGQSGQITITQHASAAKTLGFGSNWKSVDGTAQTVSTTTGAINLITYYVNSPTHITYSLIKHGVA